jgi:hypothetical protein
VKSGVLLASCYGLSDLEDDKSAICSVITQCCSVPGQFVRVSERVGNLMKQFVHRVTLPLDMYQWEALVNTLMNLRAP